MAGACPLIRILKLEDSGTFWDISRYSIVKEQHTSPQVTVALRARVTNGATYFAQASIFSGNRQNKHLRELFFILRALRAGRRAAQRALRTNLKLRCDVIQFIV
jgi:hypothetical protein